MTLGAFDRRLDAGGMGCTAATGVPRVRGDPAETEGACTVERTACAETLPDPTASTSAALGGARAAHPGDEAAARGRTWGRGWSPSSLLRADAAPNRKNRVEMLSSD